MSKLSRLLLVVLIGAPVTLPLLAQRVPEGPEHRIRDRTYDLSHLLGELTVIPEAGRIEGRAIVSLAPLAPLSRIELDAIGLEVTAVRVAGREVAFTNGSGTLRIELPAPADAGTELEIEIVYGAAPKAGIYFQPDRDDPSRYWISTYGEGGLLANWLPTYSSPNDKFTSELVVTVPAGYTVVSNGTLVGTTEAGRHTTWHWRQERPHADYLVALYIGDYERGELEPALDGRVSLAYWVPRGRSAEGAYAFRNTTRMVELYSRLFGVPYPWAKYDQIAVPDYPIGAMEHTGVTGHDEGVLRPADGVPDEFSQPHFDHVVDVWSAEATIAHELVHHWFGDDLTCADLSRIWLNESFASYFMMTWDEELFGTDELLWDVELVRRRYVDYVDSEHVIRPLEWSRWKKYGDIYQTELTYFKGAAVLHMLRRILGDDAFYASLGTYLRAHRGGNVVSEDLATTIRETSGRNLDWFFDDWVWGGGAPSFEISARYRPDRGLLDLEVLQIQPIVEGQGLFTLPVEVRIDTGSGSATHTIWVREKEEHVLFPVDGEPTMVSFDGRGDLVARIDFAKPAADLLYQAGHDELPGRLRARAQLATRYPGFPEAEQAMASALGPERFWAERADAARLLGTMRTPAALELAETALRDPDYRVRKGAVLALAGFGPVARDRLREIVAAEPHADVVGTAIVALARIGADLGLEELEALLEREAWYDELRIAAVLAAEELERDDLLPLVRESSGSRFNQATRLAALAAWEATAPADPELHALLLELASGPIYQLQGYALEALGRLGVAAAVPLLEATATGAFDENMVVLSREALDEIRRLAP